MGKLVVSEIVYRITCLSTNEHYVGSTTCGDERFKVHRFYLMRGEHWNRHLQNAWNKYGASQFEFVVLEETSNLLEREEFWINELDSWKNGFNQCPTPTQGTRGVILGPASDERRRKISVAQIGVSVPERRRSRGTRKLDWSTVQEIRTRFGGLEKRRGPKPADVPRLSDIADEYGISTAQLSQLLNNQTYQYDHASV